MKFALPFILLLHGTVLTAQRKSLRTQFDRFVNRPGIEWAAYASDTFNFQSARFNQLLVNRFAQNKIKASLPVESRTGEANEITYVWKDAVDDAFYGSRVDTMTDASGNTVTVKKPVPQIDSAGFKLTEVTQILYIEKGVLKSYIPFVTPTLPVYLSTGMYIGERFYFSTCYNYKYNEKPRKKGKLVYLLQTKKLIGLDFAKNGTELKRLYGNDLVKSLWPFVLAGKIPAYAVDKNIQLKPAELDMGLVKTWPVLTPVYDQKGAVVKYEVVPVMVDQGNISSILLTQDWYYDHKRNKLNAFIKEMIVNLKKADNPNVPFVRLVFNQ